MYVFVPRSKYVVHHSYQDDFVFVVLHLHFQGAVQVGDGGLETSVAHQVFGLFQIHDVVRVARQWAANLRLELQPGEQDRILEVLLTTAQLGGQPAVAVNITEKKKEN